ncbi:MAG: PIN domain-containing protein [Treponemataceae bacterium]
MSAKRIFFDTNILFYAHDTDAGRKHEIAAEAVSNAWEQAIHPIISVQVLQELLHNIRKKLHDDDQAVALVGDYMVWPVIANDLGLFRTGMEAMRSHQLLLWDALIVAAANRAGADELWTEDLNAGQLYGAVRAINPFAS